MGSVLYIRRRLMTNTEFLQAMSDLLDEKLEAKLETKLQPIRDDMQDMKDDMQDMKDDMQDMKDEMRGMKDDIHELQRKVAGIGMHIENCTDKNVQLLAENFIELTKKLNMAIPAAHNNYTYEIKVNYLLEEVDKIKEIIKEKIA